MAGRLRISVNGKETTVIINNGYGSRATAMFFSRIMLLLCIVVLLFYMAGMGNDAPVIAYLFVIVSIILFLGIAVRFLSKITEREIVQVNKDRLLLIHETVFRRKKRAFDMNSINSFSYTGNAGSQLEDDRFEIVSTMADRQTQAMHEKGNISFVYNGEAIFFGRRLPSWEVEKISEVIANATGGRIGFNNLQDEPLAME